MWSILVSISVAVMVIISLLCAVRAASTARTPQGAVGWVVFLLATPFLAVPLYLVLGHHRFRGYIIARRQSELVISGMRSFAKQNAPNSDKSDIALGPFEYSAGMTATGGNSAEILIDGQRAFDAMFRAIDDARTYILVQFYIIHDDAIGRDFQTHLIAAAKRGVAVRVLIDAIGCLNLPEQYREKLRAAGVEIVAKHVSRGPNFRFQINFRNHRKTVVVDGSVGFTGGLNVGDEYLGRDPVFGHWRDTHVRLVGPMVTQLQLIFAEDWHWATGHALLEELNWQPEHAAEDVTGLIVATGPGDIGETGSMMFFSAIAQAKTRLWIASPYFVPDLDVITALRYAALRGVDVRILVPDIIDHRAPWMAAFAYFDDIRDAGVRVFRYTNGFMHQKVFVVDDRVAAIGTTNLDNRSFRLNFEAMALFFDPGLARQVGTMLQADFENAFELVHTLDQQPAYIRYGAPLARLFSPLL